MMKKTSFVSSYQHIPLRIRLFAGFFAFLLFPLIILGVLGINWASSTVYNNTMTAYESIISNYGDQLDEQENIYTGIINLLCNNQLLKQIAYMRGNSVDYTRISITELQTLKNELLLHCISSRFFDDLAILFPQKNYVISTLGAWQMDWFFEDEMRPLNYDIEALRSAVGRNINFPSMQISSYGFEKKGAASFRIGINANSGTPLLSVVFWVNDQTWNNQMKDLLIYDGTIVGLYDENHSIIHINSSDLETGARLLEAADSESDAVYDKNIRYEKLVWCSQQTGAQLVVLVPSNAIYGEVRHLRLVIWTILGITALIGCALSWELAAYNYKPFEHFFHTIGKYLQGESAPNNMAEAEQKLLELIHNQEKLAKSIESQGELLQYAALLHLLDGDQLYHGIANQVPLSMLGIDLPYSFFKVIGLSGCKDEKHIEAIAKANRTENLINAYCVKRKEILTMLVNYQSNEKLDDFLLQLSPECQVLCVSDMQEQLSGISMAYLHLLSTLEQHPIDGDSNIFHYEDLPNLPVVCFSAENERCLISQLREGNQAAVQESLSALLKKNNTMATLRKLITALELTVLKTEDGHGILAELVHALAVPDPLDAQSQISYARELLDKAVEYHHKTALAGKGALAENLQLYIDENICDEQLSLSSISDKFSLSSAYLSRYFKEHFGMGYLDYVNRKRVLLAKELLSNGKYSIKEVAEKTGFGSDIALRRVFKKYEGVVPSSIMNTWKSDAM